MRIETSLTVYIFLCFVITSILAIYLLLAFMAKQNENLSLAERSRGIVKKSLFFFFFLVFSKKEFLNSDNVASTRRHDINYF